MSSGCHNRWVINVDTSTLDFNIAQIFPSLNYQLLSCIFNKVDFNPKISRFFQNYLVEQKTKYVCNFFFSSFFNVDVGFSQGLALFSILLALYIALVLYIFENQLKYLKIPISFLSFVNNGSLVSQNKLLTVSNYFPFCNYQIIFSLLNRFSFKLEHRKTEVFYFLRSTGLFNPSPLNISLLGGPILQLKNS